MYFEKQILYFRVYGTEALRCLLIFLSASSQTGTHFVLLQSLNLSETVKQVNYGFFFCFVFPFIVENA